MVNIFITIDVETSIGGAFAVPNELRPVGAESCIYGKIREKEYGIPLIMNILERFKLKGTFFVEPFCSFYFGENIVKEVCRYISNRGHDIQLHLHPNYQIFRYKDWQRRCKEKALFPDLVAKYTLDEQVEIVRMGKDILQRCGVSPLAFRAGCFGANRDTILALEKNGFLIDSSYNASYLNKTCFIKSNDLLNDITKFGSIYELPITNYYEFKIDGFMRMRNLDLCAISAYELRQVLKKALRNNIAFVVIILHSFSFVKKRDFQYRMVTPNFILINRFIKLCEFLHRHQDLFHVFTFSQLCNSIRYDPKITKEKQIHKQDSIPFIGNLSALPRYFSNAIQYL